MKNWQDYYQELKAIKQKLGKIKRLTCHARYNRSSLTEIDIARKPLLARYKGLQTWLMLYKSVKTSTLAAIRDTLRKEIEACCGRAFNDWTVRDYYREKGVSSRRELIERRLHSRMMKFEEENQI